MKKYKFRMERALSVRRLQASLERARFEQAVAELRQIEEQRRQLSLSARHAGSAANQGPATGLELASLQNFLDHNARMDRALAQRLADAGERVNAARARLMEADRKVRVLEKREERTRRKWKAEFDREIESLAGETFLARWKGSGGSR